MSYPSPLGGVLHKFVGVCTKGSSLQVMIAEPSRLNPLGYTPSIADVAGLSTSIILFSVLCASVVKSLSLFCFRVEDYEVKGSI